MRSARLLALPIALFAVALGAPAPTPPRCRRPCQPTAGAAGPNTQGIIMSDGRICNPRWGC